MVKANNYRGYSNLVAALQETSRQIRNIQRTLTNPDMPKDRYFVEDLRSLSSRNEEVSAQIAEIQREFDYHASFYGYFQRLETVARDLSKITDARKRHSQVESARIILATIEEIVRTHNSESPLITKSLSVLKTEYPSLFEDIEKNRREQND